MKSKIFFCLILLISFVYFATSAVNPLTFIAINDVIQPGSTPLNVPLRINGVVYVRPDTFTRTLGLKSFNNVTIEEFLLFNADHYIAFNSSTGSAKDENGDTFASAIFRNGNIYLPAQAICEKFSFTYSFITLSSLGNVVRISDSSFISSDSTFIENNASTMRNIYLMYVSKYMTENPDTTQPVVPDIPDIDTDIPVKIKDVQISIAVTDALETQNILENLSNSFQKATFFIDETIAQNLSLINQIYTKGHTIGILIDKDTSLDSIENINNLIKSQTMQKTNILMSYQDIASDFSDTLLQSGYALFYPTYAPTGSYQTMYSNIKYHIDRNSKVSLIFNSDNLSAKTIEYIIPYMRSNNCIISDLTIFDY